MADRTEISPPQWLRPPAEQAGLSYYLEVLRERFWIIIAAVVLSLAAAGLYLATANKVYKAEIDVLVTPAPSDDELLSALGVIRASNDPTQDVETAARLIANVNTAQQAAQKLGLDRSPTSVLNDVTAEPVAESAIVAVTAEGSTPQAAADLANAFARAAVAQRTQAVHDRIDKILPQIQAEINGGRRSGGVVPGEGLRRELARLQFLRTAQDPTISVQTAATPPASPASPKSKLTVAAAALGGLVIGIAAAFAAQTLDPRLRREQQLRSRYQLPILTRVPKQAHPRNRPLSPAAVSPSTREAYGALRANLLAARKRRDEPRSVLITGSSLAEGKTTTALNLAASLAMAGADTILIEADLRRPAIGETLGVAAEIGVVSVLLEDVSLRDALVTPVGPHLKLLLADYTGAWVSELFSLEAAPGLVDEAKELADFVVIDSPPLTAVADALPLAREVDDVVIVTRLGVSRLDRVHELAELLAANGVTPVGFALIGTAQPDRDYAYHAAPERSSRAVLPGAPAESAPVRGAPAESAPVRAPQPEWPA